MAGDGARGRRRRHRVPRRRPDHTPGRNVCARGMVRDALGSTARTNRAGSTTCSRCPRRSIAHWRRYRCRGPSSCATARHRGPSAIVSRGAKPRSRTDAEPVRELLHRLATLAGRVERCAAAGHSRRHRWQRAVRRRARSSACGHRRLAVLPPAFVRGRGPRRRRRRLGRRAAGVRRAFLCDRRIRDRAARASPSCSAWSPRSSSGASSRRASPPRCRRTTRSSRCWTYPDRMPYVVGSLGSRPATSKSMGRGKAADVGGREPKGKRHAVDVGTGMAACGTRGRAARLRRPAVGSRRAVVHQLRVDRPVRRTRGQNTLKPGGSVARPESARSTSRP